MMTKGKWKVGKSCHVKQTMDGHWYHIAHIVMEDDFAKNPCIAEVGHRGKYHDTEKDAHKPTKEQADNALYIVQAVNHHEQLLSALRRVSAWDFHEQNSIVEARKMAAEVLKAVEGKP